MFFLRRPPPDALGRLLEQAQGADLTYEEVGATKGNGSPSGYRHDLDEGLLGEGPQTFQRSVAELRRWQAHIGAGIEVLPRGATVAEGETGLLLIQAAGLWTVAPFRVVYVVEEPNSFRFAYGTLPGHPERGEASFAVARNDDNEVFLRLASFSRPVDPVARFAKPLARRIQRRYTLSYLAALRDAVAR